jgi:NADH:ubiquinone oxidoreductase subunit
MARDALRHVWRSVKEKAEWTLLAQSRVGQDESGNRFYLKRREGQLKREVALVGGLHGDLNSVPPEWTSWLHKARDDPPSSEEVARGAEWRRELRRRGLAVEARDRKRKMQREMSAHSPSSAGHISDDAS